MFLTEPYRQEREKSGSPVAMCWLVEKVTARKIHPVVGIPSIFTSVKKRIGW
jgi:hypothetical protein